MATIAKAINPKIVEPQPTGNFFVLKLLNNGAPNNGKTPAMTDLNKALPAKTEDRKSVV